MKEQSITYPVAARYKDTWNKSRHVPIKEKKDAVVFINSNCHSFTKRDEIVSALMKQKNIRVDALGKCLNTEGGFLPGGYAAKQKAFRK